VESDLRIVTGLVEPHRMAGLLVEAVASPATGIERGLEGAPARPRVAVLPQGPYVLATIRGEKRPLGHGTPAGPAPRVDRASATA